MNEGYEIDFLAVGEERSGDAIALRFGDLHGADRKGQTVVVIDGGFKEDGEQLIGHINKYYRTNRVDLAISTHPDADHSAGLEVVLSTCEVGWLWMHQPWNHTDDIAKMFKDGRVTDDSVREALRKSLDNARSLERIAHAKRIPIVEPFAGTVDHSGRVFVLGPTVAFYESLLPGFRGTPEPKETFGLFQKAFHATQEAIRWIAESWNIETLGDDGETSAENNSSTILLVVVADRYLLFTGDAGIPGLSDVADRLAAAGVGLEKLAFIQVPHHGSRRNVGPRILDRLLGARLREEAVLRSAFVSVGKNDEPKHPSKKVTNAFRRRGAPVNATAGMTKCHYYNAPGWPAREGWISSDPLPLYSQVED